MNDDERNYRQDEPLTVGKLIELLKRFPADIIVESDGCDCVGEAHGVRFCQREPDWEHPETVLIER